MRAVLSLLLLAVPAAAGEPVTTASLLRELADLEGLTRFPYGVEGTIQFSSYDRRSRAPYAPGWFANADGFGGEPEAGFLGVRGEPGADGTGTWVMARVEGPGAIVRTWTAGIGGRLEVFLDGSEEPLYAGPAEGFLRDPLAALGGAAGPGGNSLRQRDAAYLPLPFAKGLLILWTGNLKEIHFYQVQVRLYAPGVEVRSFRKEELSGLAEALAAASAALADPGGNPAPGRVEPVDRLLAPGAREELLVVAKGPAAASRLSLRVAAADPVQALRRTVLRIWFDGSSIPQVEAPLGDLFGCGPGLHPFATLPVTVAADGTMTCRFWLPWAREARFEGENWSDSEVRITGEAVVSEYAWDEARSMHFRAHWRVDHGLLAGREPVELPFLCVRGRGVLVGVAAMLMNPTPVPTPWGGWWGEGDEKIWVDDAPFPVVFGTGSEDYFNYSWSAPDLFAHPFFAQPLTTGPGNRGHVANLRWQIPDRMPFRQSLFFFMELIPHRPTPGLSYGRIAYYYAFPEARDDHSPLAPEALRVPALPPWLPLASHGTRGAVFHQAESLPFRAASGRAAPRPLPIGAGGAILWWEGQEAGSALEVVVPVAEGGRYRLGLVFLHSPRGRKARVLVDGVAIGRDPFPLHAPHGEMLRHVEEEVAGELAAGPHVITLQSVNEAGEPSAAPLGLDFLWLRRR